MDEKAQGALEYLLLIGGAVLIAAVVIGLLVSLSQSSTGQAKNAEGTYSTNLDELTGQAENAINTISG